MGAVLGTLRRAVADELGLSPETTVLSGTIDSTTSAVGTAAIRSNRCGVVIGTTSVAVSHVPTSRANLARALMTAPSPVDAQYVVLAENGAGGKALEHVATLINSSPQSLIDLAHGAPPGCDGTMFLPWLVGAMAPDPSPRARAGFTGLSLGTSPAHLARAVLEGVALNMATLLPAVERFVASRFDEITFGGGAAASPLWAQIMADVCGRTVHRVQEPRATNVRGAALLALYELDLIGLGEIEYCVPVAATHFPDPSVAAMFAEARQRMEAARELGASRLKR
jgi:xylulokinase